LRNRCVDGENRPEMFQMRTPMHACRAVAISLLPSDISEADRIADILRDEGWPQANRSLVVREALAALAEELSTKTSEEIFRFFIERSGQRAQRAKPLRNGAA
jgi:hypothetical protein